MENSGLQHAFYPFPDLGCGNEITTRGCVQPGLNPSKKSALFRQVTVHGFARQLIRTLAGLTGDAGEFGFLLDVE